MCGGPLTSGAKYGVCYRNRSCKLEYKSRQKKANPQPQRDWRRRNRLYKVLDKAKERARDKGVPFSLTVRDLPPIPDRCPILGIRLQRAAGTPTANSPALDRIVPALGYVPGNVQWLSHRANFMKSDASPAELLAFADWAVRTYATRAVG